MTDNPSFTETPPEKFSKEELENHQKALFVRAIIENDVDARMIADAILNWRKILSK